MIAYLYASGGNCPYARLRSCPSRRQRARFIGLAAAAAGSLTAQGKTSEKADQAQRAEAQATINLVEDLVAGRPAAATLPVKWEHQDYIKAQADKTYVPFTIAIEPGALTTSGVSLYLRVVKRGAEAAPPPPPVKPEKDKDKKGAVAPPVGVPLREPVHD